MAWQRSRTDRDHVEAHTLGPKGGMLRKKQLRRARNPRLLGEADASSAAAPLLRDFTSTKHKTPERERAMRSISPSLVRTRRPTIR